jgi:hypothetical protein
MVILNSFDEEWIGSYAATWNRYSYIYKSIRYPNLKFNSLLQGWEQGSSRTFVTLSSSCHVYSFLVIQSTETSDKVSCVETELSDRRKSQALTSGSGKEKSRRWRGSVEKQPHKETRQEDEKGARDCPFAPLPMQRMWRSAKSTTVALYQAYRELDACVPPTSRFTAVLIVKKCEVKSRLDEWKQLAREFT